MTTKFTKGPWYVPTKEQHRYCAGKICKLCDDDFPVVVADVNTYFTEAKANAALIACAPEMYEVLEKLSMQLTEINAHKAVDQIERLLAKARGEA